jgi:hypothetical protein
MWHKNRDSESQYRSSSIVTEITRASFDRLHTVTDMLYDRARTAARIYNITVFEPMFTVVRECKFREEESRTYSITKNFREGNSQSCALHINSRPSTILRDMIAGHYMLIQYKNGTFLTPRPSECPTATGPIKVVKWFEAQPGLKDLH